MLKIQNTPNERPSLTEKQLQDGHLYRGSDGKLYLGFSLQPPNLRAVSVDGTTAIYVNGCALSFVEVDATLTIDR